MARPQPLGFYSATALVIASMIGAGAFTISGFTLQALGSPTLVLLAWGVGGVIALTGAISYGALATQLHESGGEYVYLARRVHPLAGFLAGWVSLLAGFTGALAYAATAFEKYAGPLLGMQLPTGSLAIGIILLGLLQHAFRLQGGAWVQNTIVAAKLIALVGLIAAGWYWFLGLPPVANAEMPTPSITTFATQIVYIFLAYSGFNAAVYVSEEVRDAPRTVPRAMIAATLVVTVLYLLLNALFVYAGPIDRLAGEPDIAAVAFDRLGGPTAGVLCRILVCVALATSVSALTMSGPRVYAKMAADGLFPLPATPAGKSPWPGMILQAALAIAVVCVATLQQQLEYLGFMLMICAAATVASLFWVRPTDVASEVKWWQLLCAGVFVVAAAVLTLLTLAQKELQPTTLAAGLTLATGVAAYYLLRQLARANRASA